MKKRLILAFLLLICFWHFNVNAETLTNSAIPEEVEQEIYNGKEKAVEEKKNDNSVSKTEVVSLNSGAPTGQNVSLNKKSDVNDDVVNEQKSEDDSNNLSSNIGNNDLVEENKPTESILANEKNSNDGVLESNENNDNQKGVSNQQPIDNDLSNLNQNSETGSLQDNLVLEKSSENKNEKIIS